jgi:anti-sigma factor RsiW
MAANNNTINRSNYEEYFLMYVDNELSAPERILAEAFVQQNPDLAPELAALQQAVLLPPPVDFTAKDSLYKTATAIDHSNYTEFFVLYTDNELSAAQRKEVEAFVATNPALQAELDLFAQTHLQADAQITFDNKTGLYKNTAATLISEHNYTEYFSLYVDGELTAAQRKEVEAFAAAGPALQAGLDLFMQTRLKANAKITFDNKTGLYKNVTTTLINRHNFTEYFALYADNELTEEQKNEVGSFVNENRDTALDLAEFLLTRQLPNMSIVCPNKQALYRKEQKEKPVVIPMWLRFAAAAAVLLFVAWFAFNRGSNGTKADGIQVVTKGGDKSNNPAPQQQQVTPPAPVVNDKNDGGGNMAENEALPVTPVTPGAVKNNNRPAPIPYKAAFNNKNNGEGVTKTPAVRNTNGQQRNNNLPVPQQNNNEVIANNNNNDLQKQKEQPLPKELKQLLQLPKDDKENTVVVKNNITPESNGQTGGTNIPGQSGFIKNLVPEQEVESSSVAIMNMPAGDAGKKGGLRGFGRKVSRFFERKVKNIGNGGLSIAGIEVAVAK